MPVTDFLDAKRKEIKDKLTELRPAVEEYRRLEAAAAALDDIPGSTGKRASAVKPPNGRRRGPGRPRGSRSAYPPLAARTARSAKATSAKPARTRRGRRKGSGQRSTEALAIIKEQPGIAIPEIAARMDIKQNYLYRVLPGLKQEGKITKDGRGWHTKAASKAAA